MPGALAAQTILVMGDSLSAGYGLDAGSGWVPLLEQRLASQQFDARVANASVSGETTAGGLSRLDAALDRSRPDIVLIELGANDGLRGLPIDAMRSNLLRMIERVKDHGAQPVLFEMRLPPNLGPRYVQRFQESFREIAEAQSIPLVPFFLAPIADDPDAFQEDHLHPTAAVQPRLLDAVWPTLRPLLDEPAPAPAAQ